MGWLLEPDLFCVNPHLHELQLAVKMVMATLATCKTSFTKTTQS